jgi:hypothetical protein
MVAGVFAKSVSKSMSLHPQQPFRLPAPTWVARGVFEMNLGWAWLMAG